LMCLRFWKVVILQN